MTKKMMRALIGLSGITLSTLFNAQHTVLAEDIGNSESTTQLLQSFIQVVSSEELDYPATII